MPASYQSAEEAITALPINVQPLAEMTLDAARFSPDERADFLYVLSHATEGEAIKYLLEVHRDRDEGVLSVMAYHELTRQINLPAPPEEGIQTLFPDDDGWASFISGFPFLSPDNDS